MNEIKDGGPAFPGEESTDFIVKCQCGEMVTFNDVYHPGMTLRDWFGAISTVPNQPLRPTHGNRQGDERC